MVINSGLRVVTGHKKQTKSKIPDHVTRVICSATGEVKMDKRELEVSTTYDGTATIRMEIKHIPTGVKLNGYGSDERVLRARLEKQINEMIKADLGEMRTIFNQINDDLDKAEQVIKDAFFEGFDSRIAVGEYEEDAEDCWLKSQAFRRISTK